jgi:hypothetical protein
MLLSAFPGLRKAAAVGLGADNSAQKPAASRRFPIRLPADLVPPPRPEPTLAQKPPASLRFAVSSARLGLPRPHDAPTPAQKASRGAVLDHGSCLKSADTAEKRPDRSTHRARPGTFLADLGTFPIRSNTRSGLG